MSSLTGDMSYLLFKSKWRWHGFQAKIWDNFHRHLSDIFPSPSRNFWQRSEDQLHSNPQLFFLQHVLLYVSVNTVDKRIKLFFLLEPILSIQDQEKKNIISRLLLPISFSRRVCLCTAVDNLWSWGPWLFPIFVALSSVRHITIPPSPCSDNHWHKHVTTFARFPSYLWCVLWMTNCSSSFPYMAVVLHLWLDLPRVKLAGYQEESRPY